MTNIEICRAFAALVKESPEYAAIAMRQELAQTDFEVKVLKADPCRMHYEHRDQMHLSFLEQVEECFERR